MHAVRCPYCRSGQGRCATTPAGRYVTECTSCGRVVEERQTFPHHLFLLRAIDTPLPLVIPDIPFANNPNPKVEPATAVDDDDDPFLPTGFVTAFSAFSLEHSPIFARSSSSFSGHLAELERALLDPTSAAASDASSAGGPMVSVDHLRAYLQILDVSSLLDLDHDVVDHAFQLFRDCSSTTCLRNRSVEALATAALVQAIREAQEPRTLQEISSAANLPQKEIGKYIKILGEALKLSQPINSNSISVHMPRFCTLLQLNKSAQELAAHIGEVVINKCFCTRRNPISISAAAIYLACQLEDKRKTQAEICKVTGLTEVTLRKVYKELLENWNDLLPPNYTPAVPPEKAFPMTSIPTGRIPISKSDVTDPSSIAAQLEKEAAKHGKMPEVPELQHLVSSRGKDNESKVVASRGTTVPLFDARAPNPANFWQTQVRSGGHASRMEGERGDQGKSCSSIDVQMMQSCNSDPKTDLKSGSFQGASLPSRTSSSSYCRWQLPPRPTTISVAPPPPNPRPPVQQRPDMPSDDTGKSW